MGVTGIVWNVHLTADAEVPLAPLDGRATVGLLHWSYGLVPEQGCQR